MPTEMNQLILSSLQARRGPGHGRPQQRLGTFATRYSQLTEAYGDAMDAGDEILAERLDAEMDKLVQEAREKADVR